MAETVDDESVTEQFELLRDIHRVLSKAGTIDGLGADVLNYLKQAGAAAARVLSSAGKRVYDTPELLESILLNLDMPSILRAEQVNRQMRDAVRGSIKLQRKLFLKPEFDVPLRLLADCEPNIKRITNGCLETSELFINPDGSTRNEHEFLMELKYGSRFTRRQLDMFITQPPIRQMEAQITSCLCTTKLPTLHCPEHQQGLKVGDVYREVKAWWKKHAYCSEAYWHQHDDEGVVKTQIMFSSEAMSLGDNHPRTVRDREEQRRQMQYRERMEAYIEAKDEAREKGDVIPTLAEWQSRKAAAAEVEDTF